MREPTLEEFMVMLADWRSDPRFDTFDTTGDDEMARTFDSFVNAACDPWRRMVAS